MLRAWIISGVVLGAGATGALAFEQTGTLAKPPVSQEGAAVAGPPAPSSLEMAMPEAAEPEASGPEISLPGIGKIGTLPKFDFGLELLYGQDNKASVVEEAPVDADIRIRGTVKHKF